MRLSTRRLRVLEEAIQAILDGVYLTEELIQLRSITQHFDSRLSWVRLQSAGGAGGRKRDPPPPPPPPPPPSATVLWPVAVAVVASVISVGCRLFINCFASPGRHRNLRSHLNVAALVISHNVADRTFS